MRLSLQKTTHSVSGKKLNIHYLSSLLEAFGSNIFLAPLRDSVMLNFCYLNLILCLATPGHSKCLWDVNLVSSGNQISGVLPTQVTPKSHSHHLGGLHHQQRVTLLVVSLQHGDYHLSTSPPLDGTRVQYASHLTPFIIVFEELDSGKDVLKSSLTHKRKSTLRFGKELLRIGLREGVGGRRHEFNAYHRHGEDLQRAVRSAWLAQTRSPPTLLCDSCSRCFWCRLGLHDRHSHHHHGPERNCDG